MNGKKSYLSRNGKWHQIVWRDGKMYLKCNHAVGYKKKSEVWKKSIVNGSYNITCENCLR